MVNIKRGSCGFTLIELMITMAVVSLLAAVAYPSYVSTIRKARREDAIASLLELQLAQEKYRANNPTYTTTLGDLGFSSTDSRDGYYTLAVSSGTATAFTATAAPKTGTPQAADSCSFSITQNGPDISDATKRTCWNK